MLEESCASVGANKRGERGRGGGGEGVAAYFLDL